MKRLSLFLTAIIFAVLTVAACATKTKTLPTSSARAYDPVCTEGVAVYNDFDAVPYDYREVAFIMSDQSSVYSDKDKMIADMRKQAGDQGGNGLVINSIHSDKSTVKIIGEALGTGSSDRKGRAVAIYMPGDSARVRIACGHS